VTLASTKIKLNRFSLITTQSKFSVSSVYSMSTASCCSIPKISWRRDRQRYT